MGVGVQKRLRIYYRFKNKILKGVDRRVEYKYVMRFFFFEIRSLCPLTTRGAKTYFKISHGFFNQIYKDAKCQNINISYWWIFCNSISPLLPHFPKGVKKLPWSSWWNFVKCCVSEFKELGRFLLIRSLLYQEGGP